MAQGWQCGSCTGARGQGCSEGWLKGRKCCEPVQHPRSPMWRSPVLLSSAVSGGDQLHQPVPCCGRAPTPPCGTWDPALALVVPAPLCLHKASPRTSPATHLCQPTPGTSVPAQTGDGAGGDWAGTGRGHAVSHWHTHIFSMSSFSSKAPGRSRLFPRTRTCRAGQGTPEAPGHQTRQEPPSATQAEPACDTGQPWLLH